MTLLERLVDGVLFIFLREVARYRLNVIRNNLVSAFDYRSVKDLQVDIDANYRFLTKMIRQVIFAPSKKKLQKKMSLNPFPDVASWLRAGKSVIVTMGHTGNWEWAGLYLGLQYPGQVCALYKEIKSKPVNKLMLKRRSLTVDHLVEIKKIAELIRLMKNKPVLILMIADQNPGNDQGIVWTDFLNNKTAFVNGPETLAAKFQLPVVYLHNTTREDEAYQLSFETLTDGESVLPTGDITARYAKALEKNILSQRAEWLWSHKRWKRKYET